MTTTYSIRRIEPRTAAASVLDRNTQIVFPENLGIGQAITFVYADQTRNLGIIQRQAECQIEGELDDGVHRFTICIGTHRIAGVLRPKHEAGRTGTDNDPGTWEADDDGGGGGG